MGSSQSSLSIRCEIKGKGIKDLMKDLKQPRLLTAFSSLEILDASKNKITSVPKEIENDFANAPNVRNNLRILNISKNRLTAIPDCIYSCINIVEFRADSNQITELSDGILEFYQLKILTLVNNKIERIPYNMERLRQLQIFEIGANQLHCLPNALGSVKYGRTSPFPRMPMLEQLACFPNPFTDPKYSQFDGLVELFSYLRKQKVPDTYRHDSKKARMEEKQKIEDLTPDERLTRGLLRYSEGKTAITLFMKKEHSDENLSFYYDVRDFRKKYNSKVEIHTQKLIDDAVVIYEKYISDDGTRQVNISSDRISPIRKSFEDTYNFPKGINQWVFDDCYKESFDLMVRDTFQRFRLSAEGKKVVELYRDYKERVKNKRRKARAAGSGSKSVVGTSGKESEVSSSRH